ncbi:MAG TPA: hypothetical protein VMG62_00140 [Solirubrobacteraceae bacterium]|nr:hypothetical protein [Solirubrobacteraceae bacterium]
MRVFVAGATDAIGRPLLPALRAAGHEPIAMTRSPEKAAGLRAPAGSVAVTMMQQLRGASNARIKRELAWQPRYDSWREGFVQALG